MTDVINSEEFAAVMMMENTGRSNGTEPTMQFVSFSGNSVSVNQDIESASASAVRTSGVRSAAEDLSDEEVQQLVAQFKEKYENGDTVVLMYPSPKTINKLLVALGQHPTYIEPEEIADDEDIDAEDLYPEMFAIAKRYNGNSPHTFTYMLPSAASLMRHAAEVEDGEESEDVAQEPQPEPVLPEVSDPYEGMRTEYVFQARRYLSLRNWSAGIDSVFAEQKAFVASSFNVNAADAPTDIFNYYAQQESQNFDWSNPRHNYDHDWTYSCDATTSETIYAFHNFADERDFYIVQSTGSYYPKGYTRFKDGDYYYAYGAASYFEYTHTLDIDDADFNLFTNAPRNVNRKSTVTDGSEHNTSSTSGQSTGVKVNASVSASLADGLSASISTELSHERNTSKTSGASYNHSATWETEEWGGPSTRWVKLAQPPHVVLTSENGLTFDKNAKTNMIFKFLCNHDWTIYSTADWIRISPEQKTGHNTGPSEKSIFWELDAYDTGSDTSLHTREGLLTVQDNVTKQVQSLHVTQRNK